jgi:hypothetical protein
MTAPVRATAASLQVFLKGIIDYAGLFAPASLNMMASVNNYSRYLNHPQRWALGRFVLPVARLDEFLNVQENVAADPWQLSGIVSANIEADLAVVEEFNCKAPGAVIDSIEVRVRSQDEIELVRKRQPPATTAMYEIAPERADELLPVLRRLGGCAKLRTGGVIEEAFPTVERVAGFIARCAELGVPFKATAGLHHPLRCVRPLTYEPEPQEGTMHGFLNLFTAAAIGWSAVRAGRAVPRKALATCLADRDSANWHFGEDAMIWRGGGEAVRIDVDDLRSMRSQFALSFGSCSFEEPLQDLRELDLL